MATILEQKLWHATNMFINQGLTFPFTFSIIRIFLMLLRRVKMSMPKDPTKAEETRRKMSEALKKRYEDPKAHLRLSEAKKKQYEDPIKGQETRRKISEANKLRAPPSEETRRKISEAWKGKHHTEEARKKMSEARKGENNAFFGKKHSEATRRKISEANKNPSAETRKKMSEAQKLRAPVSEEDRQKMREILKNRYADPIKGEEIRKKISEGGQGKKRSEATRKKMSMASKMRAPPSAETRKKISESWKLRAPVSEETRRKQGEARKGRHHTSETRVKMSEAQKGEKGSGWMGGISFFPYCPKFNNEFKERVRAFFDYQCVECGEPQKEKALAVHHVNFNKGSCCNPDAPRLFVPLCASCHAKTSYNREYWEQHFTEMINKYYGGKCYFLTEEMIAIEREKRQ